jgi:hypothetical protein
VGFSLFAKWASFLIGVFDFSRGLKLVSSFFNTFESFGAAMMIVPSHSDAAREYAPGYFGSECVQLLVGLGSIFKTGCKLFGSPDYILGSI